MGDFGRRHPWTAFAVRRLFTLMIGLVVVMVATFMIVQLVPGDPARAIAGPDAPPEYVEQLRDDLGLNDPTITQFADYVTGAITLDFGSSFATDEPVSEVIGDRLPRTAKLAGISIVVVLGVAIPLGIVAGALTQGGRRPKTEGAFAAVTGAAAAVPEFVLAMLLVFVFAVTLSWLPVAGSEGATALILPVVAITFRPVASLARVVRVQTLDVLGRDFVRTARGKRLPVRLLYLRHALPNLLTAALTIGGLLFTGLLGGSVIVENVFAWQGLGTAIVNAIQGRDFPVIQAIVLLLAAAVLVVNALVDVALAAIDPRSAIRDS